MPQRPVLEINCCRSASTIPDENPADRRVDSPRPHCHHGLPRQSFSISVFPPLAFSDQVSMAVQKRSSKQYKARRISQQTEVSKINESATSSGSVSSQPANSTRDQGAPIDDINHDVCLEPSNVCLEPSNKLDDEALELLVRSLDFEPRDHDHPLLRDLSKLDDEALDLLVRSLDFEPQDRDHPVLSDSNKLDNEALDLLVRSLDVEPQDHDHPLLRDSNKLDDEALELPVRSLDVEPQDHDHPLSRDSNKVDNEALELQFQSLDLEPQAHDQSLVRELPQTDTAKTALSQPPAVPMRTRPIASDRANVKRLIETFNHLSVVSKANQLSPRLKTKSQNRAICLVTDPSPKDVNQTIENADHHRIHTYEKEESCRLKRMCKQEELRNSYCELDNACDLKFVRILKRKEKLESLHAFYSEHYDHLQPVAHHSPNYSHSLSDASGLINTSESTSDETLMDSIKEGTIEKQKDDSLFEDPISRESSNLSLNIDEESLMGKSTLCTIDDNLTVNLPSKAAGSSSTVIEPKPTKSPLQSHRHVPVPPPSPPLPQLKVCTSRNCPVLEFHTLGLYLHKSKFRARPEIWFGDSNPPPIVWYAVDMVTQGKGTRFDNEIIAEFIRLHYHVFKEVSS